MSCLISIDRRGFQLSALIVIMAMPLLAAPTDPTPTPLPKNCPGKTVRGPRVGTVAEYMLANGLTLLLIPDSSVAVTRVTATYRVGSRHEGQGETGVAHLLEHMLFRGTPKHPDLPRELARRGARYNATTTEDYTSYFETFPSSDDNLAWALELEADRMVNGALRAEDLPAERSVVLREIDRAESDPFRVLLERTSAAAYAWHPYGKVTAGSRLDVERMTTTRLQEFYRRHYHPQNVVVSIAGRLDERAAVAVSERLLGTITALCTAQGSPSEYSMEPAQEGERRIFVPRSGKDEPRALVAYHIPALSHPDAAAVAVLGKVLTYRDEGLLTRAVEPLGSIGAAILHRHDPSLLTFSTTPKSGVGTDRLLERLLPSIDSAASHAPSQELIERARTSLLADMDKFAEPRLDFAARLSEWIGAGDWRLFYVHRARLEKVTLADVRRVAKTYLQASNRTVGVVVPAAASIVTIPGAPSLAGEFALLEAASAGTNEKGLSPKVPAAGGDAPGGAEVTWDGSPERLMDAVRVDTLPNGLRVATLRTDDTDVIVRLAVRYGSNTLLEGRWGAAQLFSLIPKFGPAEMTATEFNDLKTRLQIDMGASFGVGNLTVNVNAKRDNLDQALRLLNQTIRNPRLDSASIAKARQEQELAARAAERSSILLARNTLLRRLWQLPASHPLYDPTSAEREASSKSVSDAEVAKLYQELWSPGNMVLLVVGDVARDTVHRTAREVFGDWSKSGPRAEELVAPYVETRPEHIAVPVTGLREAQMVAGLLVPLGRDSADLKAMQVAAHIIGSGVTTSRLGARIREQAGLSYTVFGSLESPRGAASLFIIRANAAAGGLQRVEELARAELAAILRDGFSEEEVSRAKEEMANSWRGFVGQPRQVVRLLLELLSTGRNFSDELAGQRRLSAVTAESATQAARKYLDPARLVVVHVGADVR